jgi:SAM-dependent methyltransferase
MVEIQYFASNGIEADVLDCSVAATDILNRIAKEKLLPIKSQTFDVKNPLPFPDGYFDAVYSHMLFNMCFSADELHFIFSEIILSFLSETIMTNPTVRVGR